MLEGGGELWRVSEPAIAAIWVHLVCLLLKLLIIVDGVRVGQ